jgi:putative hydrolase of the HAD superfamily
VNKKMNNKRLIIFIDSGDTLVSEVTEVRNADGVIIHSELIEGAADALKLLHEEGYPIVLVADGSLKCFENIYAEQGLRYCFDGWVVSEVLGVEKPDALMFQNAMEQLGLVDADKGRIIMIGNNLQRDVLGANLFGIVSVWLDWTIWCPREPRNKDEAPDFWVTRYPREPRNQDEVPDYTVHTPADLPALAERLEAAIARGENIKIK